MPDSRWHFAYTVLRDLAALLRPVHSPEVVCHCSGAEGQCKALERLVEKTLLKGAPDPVGWNVSLQVSIVFTFVFGFGGLVVGFALGGWSKRRAEKVVVRTVNEWQAPVSEVSGASAALTSRRPLTPSAKKASCLPDGSVGHKRAPNLGAF